MTHDTLGTVAAGMTERGWFVFPVAGKEPLVSSGFHSAVGTPAEALAIFSKRSKATGIGIDCGRSGLLVVDLDDPPARTHGRGFCSSTGSSRRSRRQPVATTAASICTSEPLMCELATRRACSASASTRAAEVAMSSHHRRCIRPAVITHGSSSNRSRMPRSGSSRR